MDPNAPGAVEAAASGCADAAREPVEGSPLAGILRIGVDVREDIDCVSGADTRGGIGVEVAAGGMGGKDAGGGWGAERC